jgi:hypothetical protein
MPLISASVTTGHMARGGNDFWAWLRNQLQSYFGNNGNSGNNGNNGNFGSNGNYGNGRNGWYLGNSKGSVPIPGTFLLFGGGFIGLMVWRKRQQRI